jgi:hypothetical protein
MILGSCKVCLGIVNETAIEAFGGLVHPLCLTNPEPHGRRLASLRAHAAKKKEIRRNKNRVMRRRGPKLGAIHVQKPRPIKVIKKSNEVFSSSPSSE